MCYQKERNQPGRTHVTNITEFLFPGWHAFFPCRGRAVPTTKSRPHRAPTAGVTAPPGAALLHRPLQPSSGANVTLQAPSRLKTCSQTVPRRHLERPGQERGGADWKCVGTHESYQECCGPEDSCAATHRLALEGQGGPSEIPLFFYPILVESAQIPPGIFLFLFLKFLYLV